MIESLLLSFFSFFLGTIVGPKFLERLEKRRKTLKILPIIQVLEPSGIFLPEEVKNLTSHSGDFFAHRFQVINRSGRDLGGFQIQSFVPRDDNCHCVVNAASHDNVISSGDAGRFALGKNGISFKLFEKNANLDFIVYVSSNAMPKLVISEGFFIDWIAPSYDNFSEYGYGYGYIYVGNSKLSAEKEIV